MVTICVENFELKILSEFKLNRYTVTRRKPDVRFGEPDEKASGFRISGFRTSESVVYRPVQNPTSLDRFIYKGGHKENIYLQ